MPEQQTKPKNLSMVQQSIEDARNSPAFTPEMQAQLDALVSAPLTRSEVNDLTARLKRAIIERALNAEMNLHLGYAPGEDMSVSDTRQDKTRRVAQSITAAR